jgi:hypothetical protein
LRRREAGQRTGDGERERVTLDRPDRWLMEAEHMGPTRRWAHHHGARRAVSDREAGLDVHEDNLLEHRIDRVEAVRSKLNGKEVRVF